MGKVIHMEWWQRFNLRDNPFERTKSPLLNSYEYIIETSIYNKYCDRLKNIEDTLFGKVIVIGGLFGSGKTTLFEYLKNKISLLNKRIETITIPISTRSSNGDEIFSLFKSQLYNTLCDEERQNVYPNDISNQLILRSQEKKLDGYIIFIDELHHNPNIDAIFDFLQLSQGLTEYIFKFNKVGIFIAGSDLWIERLQEPTYRGPIDRFDRMDEITIDQSYQIITKRWAEFIKDPKQKKSEFITKDAVEKIYGGLIEKTPRWLLIDTGELYENLPENVMKLSSHDVSKKVDTTTLEVIRKKLEGIPIFHQKMCIIIKEYKNNDDKNIALRFISKLYERGFIERNAPIEILKEFGLKDSLVITDFELWGIIKKVSAKQTTKGLYGTSTITKNGYKLDDIFTNLFDTIVTSHKFYPEDYLEKIYNPRATDIRSIKEKKEELYKSKEDEYLTYITLQMKDNKYTIGQNYITRCKEQYNRIFDYLDNPRIKIDPTDIPGKCKRSLFDLFSAYYIFQKGDDDARLEDTGLLDFAVNSFHSEELRNFFHEVNAIERAGKSISITNSNAIARLYIQSLKEILPQIMEEIKFGKKFGLDPLTLTPEDMVVFREVRALLHQDSVSDITIESARDKTIKHFEKRMRTLIAGCLNIQFGQDWYKEKIPDYANSDIRRALNRRTGNEPDYHQEENILVYTDQTHLRDIILQNWTQLFNFIFHGTPDKNDEKKKELEVNWNLIYRKRQDFAHIDKSGGRYVSKTFDNVVLIIQWLNKSIEFFLMNDQSFFEKKEGYIDLYFHNKKYCNPQLLTKEDVSKIWLPLQKESEKTLSFKSLPAIYKESARKELAVYRLLLNKGCLSIKEINVNNVTFKIHKEALFKNGKTELQSECQ